MSVHFQSSTSMDAIGRYLQPDRFRIISHPLPLPPSRRSSLISQLISPKPENCFGHFGQWHSRCGLCPGRPDDLKDALRARGLTLHDVPPPPQIAFAEATLIIHHGGIGTTEACLMLGRPQLLLTRHLEQGLNGSLTRSLDVADTLKSGSLAQATAQIREMCCSLEWAARAAEVALSIQQHKPGRSLS